MAGWALGGVPGSGVLGVRRRGWPRSQVLGVLTMHTQCQRGFTDYKAQHVSCARDGDKLLGQEASRVFIRGALAGGS